ncbi:MAG: PulJ/GspJ family protein [Longimicrobiales bacterium]
MTMRPTGVTLLEALVAVVIGTVLVTLAGRTLLHAMAVSRDAVVRDDRLVARRIARLTLRSELAALGPGEARSSGGDSLRLRAVRGTGRICLIESDGVVVDLQAGRSPEPDKDSLELIGSLGAVYAVDLIGTAVEPDACGATTRGRPTRLRSSGRVDSDVIFVRLFETGSYHLDRGALRYRRGRGGRQPLTPEVWDGTSSLLLDPPWIRVSLLEVSGDSMPVPLLVRAW